MRAVEEMLKQTEEDADKEILEMKTGYEIDLKREAESNVKLRWVKKKQNKLFQWAQGWAGHPEEETHGRAQGSGGAEEWPPFNAGA